MALLVMKWRFCSPEFHWMIFSLLFCRLRFFPLPKVTIAVQFDLHCTFDGGGIEHIQWAIAFFLLEFCSCIWRVHERSWYWLRLRINRNSNSLRCVHYWSMAFGIYSMLNAQDSENNDFQLIFAHYFSPNEFVFKNFSCALKLSHFH